MMSMTMGAEASVTDVVAKIVAGDRKTAARLLSRVEHNDPAVIPVLKSLYRLGGSTDIIGITGPPGAGKSTLINGIIQQLRARGDSIAVLAVDPSSPFTGGAILGDRVRMNQHASDRGVFIRSMAARGHLGGLSKAAADAITVLDAMPFDVIIVETVGVGQSEVDIVRHANTVLLVQPPSAGDKIQAFKSGIMEVADIFVVNKADLPGADEFVRNIRETITLHYHDAEWMPSIVASQANSGEGMDVLLDEIERRRHYLDGEDRNTEQRGIRKIKYRVAEICEQLVRRQVFDERDWSGEFHSQIEKVRLRELDPYSVAEMLLAWGNAE
jgi:GTPase